MHKLIEEWQLLLLWFIFFTTGTLIILKIRNAYGDYKEALSDEYLSLEKDYSEMVKEEGRIYDGQLKYTVRLNEISGLYEITKDMSKGLRFFDIFRVLAEYLQKRFLFRKIQLMLIKDAGLASTEDIVYESIGMTDNILRSKGIFPKFEVMKRPPGEHDKKIADFMRNDVRRLQIVKTAWSENPYAAYLPEEAQTYVAVPMMIENRLAAIAAIEDLPTQDFEKFSILAAQFALEMERIILYEKVEEMAITDGLTRAFAKRHIMERLSEEFERSERHNFSLSFLMVDIDYFKNYNDTYGHLVGDVVLRDIVSILKANTREVDLVGRFGGEEFCVILPETRKEEARLVAERLRAIIERHKFKAYDESTNVTVSIGVAVYPADAKDKNELIENSDKALYAAKKAGRNRICVYGE